MKTVGKFCLGRTIIVVGAMFVGAWAIHRRAVRTKITIMAVAHTQNMPLHNAFTCPNQYKTCLAIKLQHGSVITRNIPVG